MTATASAPAGYRGSGPRERAVATVLSVAIIVAMLLLAIWQSGVVAKLESGRSLVAFDVSPAGASPKARTRALEQKPVQKTAASKPHTAPIPRPKIVIANPKAQTSDDFGIPGFIHLTRAQMAASDIGKMKGKELAKGDGDNADRGTGDGPGGARLYNPDWYRKPTDAELAGYLPKRNPGAGWGMIACQTAERHRVENCQILGESPGGSGYGLAVLNAAWQFQVIPPRVNAQPQLGAWVRIRIDYSERGSRVS